MYVATVPQPDETSLIVTRPDGGPLLDSRIADEVFKDASHPVISRLKPCAGGGRGQEVPPPLPQASVAGELLDGGRFRAGADGG
jgi:hypothetical protein